MMKSSESSRLFLKKTLIEALKNHPGEQSLQDALDIVDDLIKYHSFRKNLKSVYVLLNPSNNKIYVYHPATMNLIGCYDWDNNTHDLGIIVETALL